MDASLPLPLGLDMAKRTFDACVRLASGKYRHRKFDNQLAGFRALLAWLQQLQVVRVHACLEATGTYGEALAAFLHAQGHTVSVVNPKRTVHFAKSRLARAKTDKVDARLIADFCHQEQPALWTPPAPAYRELQALMRHRETLLETQIRERNRLEAAEHPPLVRQSLEALLTYLAESLAATEAAIRAHVKAHPELQAQKKLLLTIPGIGATTAHWLLAELGGGHGFRRAREVAAYAGVEPRIRESGQWVGTTRMSKQGNAWLRKALYYPALTALRCNPVLQAFGARLRERGKVPMAIVGAAMRKLLHIVFGVLRHEQAFDAAWTD